MNETEHNEKHKWLWLLYNAHGVLLTPTQRLVNRKHIHNVYRCSIFESSHGGTQIITIFTREKPKRKTQIENISWITRFLCLCLNATVPNCQPSNSYIIFGQQTWSACVCSGSDVSGQVYGLRGYYANACLSRINDGHIFVDTFERSSVDLLATANDVRCHVVGTVRVYSSLMHRHSNTRDHA